MSPDTIMKRLIDHVGAVHTITRVAQRISAERSRVSATIHYLRINEDIRKALMEKFDIRFYNAQLRTNKRTHTKTVRSRKATKQRRSK